jgi:hypothetical protein
VTDTPDNDVDAGVGTSDDIETPRLGAPFDPTQDREVVRKILALGFLALLFFTVGGIMLPVTFGSREWSEVESMAASLLPSVLGVGGTVLAFYFASSSQRG